MSQKLKGVLKTNDVIPIVTTIEEFEDIIIIEKFTSIILKVGDINTLPKLIKKAHNNNKFIMVHQDSIKGVGTDKYGIQYYSNLGVDCIITTKPHYINTIKGTGMTAILCLFLIDLAAFTSGIESLRNCKADAVIVMPMTIPQIYIQKIISRTRVDVIVGGLVSSKEDILEGREKGAIGIATGNQELLDEIAGSIY